jgi:hypothetical protein
MDQGSKIRKQLNRAQVLFGCVALFGAGGSLATGAYAAAAFGVITGLFIVFEAVLYAEQRPQ